MQQVNGVQKHSADGEMPGSFGTPLDELHELPGELLGKLKAPLPPEAVSPIPERPGLSAIKVIYVVERLNDVFGLNGWRVRNDVVESGRMVVVKATLTAPTFGISIEQYGGNDNPDRGDAYKGACTDALSKCASYLGVGMDVYKGLHDPRMRGGAGSETHRAQPPRHTQVRNPPADGLTMGNMAGRFTALRGVLGERPYRDLLDRHGYKDVIDIPSVDKGRESYRLLLGSFRERFAEVKRTIGQAEYEQIMRDMRFSPKARLTPEQAIRVFNRLEKAVCVQR
jgi:hypothetical protein